MLLLRCVNTVVGGQGAERRGVFGQTGPAVGEARFEVIGGDIEHPVAAEYIHHLVRVDAQCAADGAYLVAEHDFQCVEGVVDIFHHFSHRDIGGDIFARQRTVKLLHRGGGTGRIGAHQRERRIQKIVHRGAFAEEFRIGYHGEIHPGGLPRLLSQDAGHLLVGAGGDGAADGHHVEGILGSQCAPYLARHCEDI